jgi:TRAP-type mannitol/chloroaromatic compound transport system substrate-binding protein
MRLTRRRTLAAAAATFAAPAVLRAQAKHAWRIQGFVPKNFTAMEEFEKWGKEITRKTSGAITIEVLGAGAVVPVTDTLDAMKSGVLTGHYNGAPYFAGKDPAFAVLGDTLAAYENAAQRDRWFDEGGGLALARKLYARFGAHYIANIYTPEEWLPARKPLLKLDDLKGLKIRAPQGTVSELFKRAGAGVVVIPFTEVFNAMESGVIDATDAAWVDLNDKLGLHKVAKFEIYARHSMGTTDITVSQKAWAALSAEHKRLIEAELRAFSRHLKELYDVQEIAAKQRVQSQGVTLVHWSASEYDKVRAHLFEIWKEMSAQSSAAKEMVQSHLAFMKKLGLLTPIS